jgi:hypothetical protein
VVKAHRLAAFKVASSTNSPPFTRMQPVAENNEDLMISARECTDGSTAHLDARERAPS